MRLDRAGPDYFLGAIVFNMAFAEGVFARWLAFDLTFRRPRPEDFEGQP